MMLAIGYTVVMSWIFKYTFMSLSGSLYAMGQDMSQIGPAFDAAAPGADTIGEAIGMMLQGGIFGVGNSMWLIIGLVVAMIIMALGVANGIEKANKIMMPCSSACSSFWPSTSASSPALPRAISSCSPWTPQVW